MDFELTNRQKQFRLAAKSLPKESSEIKQKSVIGMSPLILRSGGRHVNLALWELVLKRNMGALVWVCWMPA